MGGKEGGGPEGKEGRGEEKGGEGEEGRKRRRKGRRDRRWLQKDSDEYLAPPLTPRSLCP